jgi:hypothetical protein
MVWLFLRVTFENFYSHLKQVSILTNTLSSFSVKAFGVGIPAGVPVELIQPIVIGGINNSGLALRKGDKFVTLILRLDNFVSRNTNLWHGPSLKGICYQPHFNIVTPNLEF